MKDSSIKLQIYKGMIQYILESTDYNLSNIAELSDISFSCISEIYLQDSIPKNFKSEVRLIQLYQIIIETNLIYKKHNIAI